MTLGASIQLQDRVSRPLQAITKALNITISTFEQMNRASANPIDTAGLATAREALNGAGADIRRIQEEIERAGNRQEGLNNNIREAERQTEEAERQQREYNSEISRGQQLMDGFAGKIKGAVGAYLGIQGIKKGIEFIQNSIQAYDVQREAEERLTEIMRTRMQATDEVINSVKELASAQQEIGVIGDEVQMFGAQQLATFLDSPDALKMLMPSMNDLAVHVNGIDVSTDNMKQIGNMIGKGMQGQVAALQRAGVTMKDYQAEIIEKGDEMERAAMLVEVIAQNTGHMNEVMANTPMGVIKQIKNAWGDFDETVGGKLYPSVMRFFRTLQENVPNAQSIIMGLADAFRFIISGVSSVISVIGNFMNIIKNNWSSIEPLYTGIGNAIQIAFSIALPVIQTIFTLAGHAFVALASVGSAICENWDLISPIIYGVAAAIGVFTIATQGASLASGIFNAIHSVGAAIMTGYHIAQDFLTVGYAVLTGSTNAATLAASKFNSTLLASPLVWIMLIIIAIIAVIYTVIAVINKWKGTTISATGVICGAFLTVAAVIGNAIIALINFGIDCFVSFYNYLASFAEFFANFLDNPVRAVVHLVKDMVDTLLGLIQSLASGIDTLFKTNLADSVQNWRDKLDEFITNVVGENEVQIERYDSSELHLDGFDYGAAWNTGYSFGQGIDDTVRSMFDFSGGEDKDGLKKLEDSLGTSPYDGIDSGMLDGLGDGIDDIAKNTDKIANSDALNKDSSDMELVKNIAERTYMDKTISIKVDMTNNNSINSSLDIDGIMGQLVGQIEEQLPVLAEGVHI